MQEKKISNPQIFPFSKNPFSSTVIKLDSKIGGKSIGWIGLAH